MLELELHLEPLSEAVLADLLACDVLHALHVGLVIGPRSVLGPDHVIDRAVVLLDTQERLHALLGQPLLQSGIKLGGSLVSQCLVRGHLELWGR